MRNLSIPDPENWLAAISQIIYSQVPTMIPDVYPDFFFVWEGPLTRTQDLKVKMLSFDKLDFKGRFMLWF